MNPDRPNDEPWWREWDGPESERLLAELDRHYLVLAGAICRDEKPSGQAWSEFLFVIAEAATSGDPDAIAAAHDAARTLLLDIPNQVRWAHWQGRLTALRDALWFMHFCRADEPID